MRLVLRHGEIEASVPLETEWGFDNYKDIPHYNAIDAVSEAMERMRDGLLGEIAEKKLVVVLVHAVYQAAQQKGGKLDMTEEHLSKLLGVLVS